MSKGKISLWGAYEIRERLLGSEHPAVAQSIQNLASLLELDAALLAERAPRRRAAAESIVARASADRSVAPDAFAQLQATCRALLQLALESVAPEGGES